MIKQPVNPLTPNDAYRGRTAPLTSKFAFYIFIQQIYLLNILNMVYTLRFFFFLQTAVCFIILTYLVPVLFTFYIQDVLKFKKNHSGAKRFIMNQQEGGRKLSWNKPKYCQRNLNGETRGILSQVTLAVLYLANRMEGRQQLESRIPVADGVQVCIGDLYFACRSLYKMYA